MFNLGEGYEAGLRAGGNRLIVMFGMSKIVPRRSALSLPSLAPMRVYLSDSRLILFFWWR